MSALALGHGRHESAYLPPLARRVELLSPKVNRGEAM